MNLRWAGVIICIVRAIGTDPVLAENDRTTHFAESFLIAIGGCSQLINNIPTALLRTQHRGKPDLTELQRTDALLMGRSIRDWTDGDIDVAKRIGIRCFGEQSGSVFGESVKHYVSAFGNYDQQLIGQKEARRRLERENDERNEQQQAEQLRQQIESDKEKARIAADRMERLTPLIADAEKSAEVRKKAEGDQQMAERLEHNLRANTPVNKLRSSYKTYAILRRCKAVRDGYAAMNLSDAEMSSAKMGIKKIEEILEPQLEIAPNLNGGSVGRVTKDDLWRAAAIEAQKETQSWDSRTPLNDFCHQMLLSLLAGERQLSGDRLLKKDF